MKRISLTIALFVIFLVIYYISDFVIDKIVRLYFNAGDDHTSNKFLNQFKIYVGIKDFIGLSLAILISIKSLKFNNERKAYYILVGTYSSLIVLSFIAVKLASLELEIVYVNTIPQILAILLTGYYFHRTLLDKRITYINTSTHVE